jgi:hypothetical protein
MPYVKVDWKITLEDDKSADFLVEEGDEIRRKTWEAMLWVGKRANLELIAGYMA